MFPTYVDMISHFAFSVYFEKYKVCVLMCLVIFCYKKKMDQKICIKFCVKNKIKYVAFGESTLSKKKCL